MPQTQKAVTFPVDFGFAILEGLILPDGSYAVAVSQVAAQFSVSTSNATKAVKSLLGGDSGLFLKVASDLNNRPVNTISIKDFKTLVFRLSQKGDPVAAAFVEAMIHEGIERRFDTAAGVKVEESEYNRRLAERMKRVRTFRKWTDVIRDRHRMLHGCDAPGAEYRELVVSVNEALFNVPHFQCDRDNMTESQQDCIRTFEGLLCRLAEMNPLAEANALVEQALKVWKGQA